MESSQILIQSPLRGQWAIMNPPGHPILAYDFLAVDDKRQPYPGKYLIPHIFARIPVSTVYAWSKPVYAPLNGIVVECANKCADREHVSLAYDLITQFFLRPKPGSPFSDFGGNYVVIKSGDCFALLAHLRRDSMLVKVGDRVEVGQKLAEVGNSGSSIQPHLHFQIMESEDPFPATAKLLPFKLKSFRKREGKEWNELQATGVKNGDHLYL